MKQGAPMGNKNAAGHRTKRHKLVMLYSLL
jgi:hypothetical protein